MSALEVRAAFVNYEKTFPFLIINEKNDAAAE